jgi:hypothetical protein
MALSAASTTTSSSSSILWLHRLFLLLLPLLLLAPAMLRLHLLLWWRILVVVVIPQARAKQWPVAPSSVQPVTCAELLQLSQVQRTEQLSYARQCFRRGVLVALIPSIAN